MSATQTNQPLFLSTGRTEKAQPPPPDLHQPNSTCTVQVCRRMTTAGLRGTVPLELVTHTHCGAATVAKLESDFYENFAAYGQQKHRLMYPASVDPDMARTLRSLLGFQGQLSELCCATCNADYLTACKSRSSSSEAATNTSHTGLFGSIFQSASDAAQALLQVGGLGGAASSGDHSAEHAAHVSSGNLVGAATSTKLSGSLYRRI